MSTVFPYTYIGCTCNAQSARPDPSTFSRRASHQVQPIDEDEDDEPLNPHDPRSNFSLYPYDHLLFCDECHETRCPRCWTEEITNWYCPSCLFEVPSSIIKTDGNRCTRNCYNCPLCTSPLSINALDQQNKDNLSVQDASQPSGPFFLSCPYCDWSTLDIGIEFSKPTKITDQLVRLRKRKFAGNVDSTSSIQHAVEDSSQQSHPLSKEAQFANLSRFYKSQLEESDGAANNPYGDSSYNSPSNLARIMQIYGGLSAAALKKSREKPQPMREALTSSEGLSVIQPDSDAAIISRLAREGLTGTTIHAQRSSHPWNHSARFTSDLWPIPALLRTRRSKRCSTCRHILIKLDDRKTTSSSGGTSSSSSSKYKIRLLAPNHIPRLSLRLFTPGITTTAPNPSPAFALTPAALKAAHDSREWDLAPHKPVQYLLTLTNPLFESVKVNLATPSITPGRVKSKITILCPSFEIGADGDMWDEALAGNDATSASSSSRGISATTRPARDISGDDRQPEAGKVWARGRNWTSVVVEVVPGSTAVQKDVFNPFAAKKAAPRGVSSAEVAAAAKAGLTIPEEETEDEDGPRAGDEVLEIPILVRVEWEAEVTASAGETGAGSTLLKPGGKPAKEAREVEFWAVVGAGRILG